MIVWENSVDRKRTLVFIGSRRVPETVSTGERLLRRDEHPWFVLIDSKGGGGLNSGFGSFEQHRVGCVN